MQKEKIMGKHQTVINPENLEDRLAAIEDTIKEIMREFSVDEDKIINREYIIKEYRTFMTVGVKIRYQEKITDLKDTVELMTSENWEDRFCAEYAQTRIRYEKLSEMIDRRAEGQLDFETPIPLESWRNQLCYMRGYLNELQKRADKHGIELPKN